jgi:exopolyphosphatase/guanosine-5'-triphosphate,3'-diphosphate pyrophosphatase
MLIATLTRYAKSKLPASSHIQKYKELLPDEHTCNVLSFLLSLSIALLSHRPRNIDFEIEFQDNELKIISKNKLYLAQETVKKLECSHKEFQVVFL